MVAAGGAFAPNDEVDEVRWLAPEDAIRVLSYPHDRELIRSLGEP
jgi:8-oxo-dGTP diphosphatase